MIILWLFGRMCDFTKTEDWFMILRIFIDSMSFVVRGIAKSRVFPQNESTEKYDWRLLVQGMVNVGFIALVLCVLDEDTQVLRDLVGFLEVLALPDTGGYVAVVEQTYSDLQESLYGARRIFIYFYLFNNCICLCSKSFVARPSSYQPWIFTVLWCARKCTPLEPLGCCEGMGHARGPQLEEKAPLKQLASLPQ